MSTDEYVPSEAELDSWMARAYEAEKRAWQAEHRITRLEAQTNIRGRAVVMYRERARKAEAERDYRRRENEELSVALNLALTGEEVQTGERHSNAVALAHAVLRADRAEARIKAVRDVLDQAWEEFDNVDASDIRRALDN